MEKDEVLGQIVKKEKDQISSAKKLVLKGISFSIEVRHF